VNTIRAYFVVVLCSLCSLTCSRLSAQIYVSDGYIRTYSLSGEIINENFIMDPRVAVDFTLDNAGNIYVSQPSGLCVSSYSPSGTVISSPLIYGLSPRGIVCDGSKLYIANEALGVVSTYSLTGTLLNPSFITGLASGGPLRLALDNTGNLYVSAFLTGQVGKYTTTGQTINASFITGLQGAMGLTVDDIGNVYVGNWGFHSVSKFAADGSLIDLNLVTGIGIPIDVALDGYGGLYVADNGINSSIGKYTTDGEVINASFIITAGSPAALVFVPEPSGIALTALGAIFLIALRKKLLTTIRFTCSSPS